MPATQTTSPTAAAYGDILYDVADRVATITLNRPDRLNAWTQAMEDEMRDALLRAEADDAVRAIVITGAGRGFCAGADMGLLSGAVASQGSAAPREADEATPSDDFDQKFSYMLKIRKPIIAAINGPLAGIGLCMVLFTDLRFMAEGARLTTAFARRGLIAEHGSSWMLPRLIGNMNALDLLFSGRLVDAAEAERLGLVRRLPAEGFLDAVTSYARDLITASSPRSIGVIKQQVHTGMFQSLAEAWNDANRAMEESFHTEDFREGVNHFVEKRAPAFTGR
ncbi:enoyl-CoA hydratase [Tistrella sp. BH-R2-4]|uniref:Enoyl-CoA hydratase n=1 Tax=Tistrella arctica TaxID=3133430 RepID=A0ABU9YRV6_9PROT